MENNMNYGRQLKISHYMIQRHFFEGLLNHSIENMSKDGDFTFRYTGHIFPENILWLKENGIDVFTTRNTDTSDKFFCYEVNILTVSDEITLTEDEVAESSTRFENLASQMIKEIQSAGSPLDKFLEVLGISGDDTTEDDDDSDDDFDIFGSDDDEDDEDDDDDDDDEDDDEDDDYCDEDWDDEEDESLCEHCPGLDFDDQEDSTCEGCKKSKDGEEAECDKCNCCHSEDCTCTPNECEGCENCVSDPDSSDVYEHDGAVKPPYSI